MSGIAGVFHFDGRPAGPEPLDAVLARLAHRGPDGCARWSNGPVALGFQAMHTTPEAEGEPQPFVKGSLAIVFHGRLDNREELKEALHPAGNGDAELALLACDAWGDDAPGRLLGDFALAFWDGRKRRLLCARDWIGTRPFAYAVLKDRFVFASEPGALFGDPGLSREPNEGMIGEFLANAITHREETVWKGVLRLPPSHLLIADGKGVRTKQYSPRTVASELPPGTDADYGDRFRSIFREAVLCRLRSQEPVCADLSGGLDSSSIVGMAHSLYNAGAAQGKGFEAFSLGYAGHACDETPFIQEVAKLWGISPNFAQGAVPGRDTFSLSAARSLDIPGYPNSAMSLAIRPLARQRGFRVALLGNGSDEWLTGFGPRRGGLLRAGLRSVLPRPAFEGLARVMGKRRAPAWILPEFARRNSLSGRIHAKDLTRPPVRGAEAAKRFARVCSGWEQHMLEVDERDASWFGLELRYPFHDLRLASFALSVPRAQLRRGSVTKFVLRTGLRDLLPAVVRERRTKADVSHLFADALRARGGAQAFRSAAIASLNWVDPGLCEEMYEKLMQDEAEGRLYRSRMMWPLWMMSAVEIWYTATRIPATGPRIRGGDSR